MKKAKRLALNAETLMQLDGLRAVQGAGPTVVSQCKKASDCVACTTTQDPDLCQVSWASNCVTYTC